MNGITAKALLDLGIVFGTLPTAAFYLLWSEPLAAAINFFERDRECHGLSSDVEAGRGLLPAAGEGFAFAALMSVTN